MTSPTRPRIYLGVASDPSKTLVRTHLHGPTHSQRPAVSRANVTFSTRNASAAHSVCTPPQKSKTSLIVHEGHASASHHLHPPPPSFATTNFTPAHALLSFARTVSNARHGPTANFGRRAELFSPQVRPNSLSVIAHRNPNTRKRSFAHGGAIIKARHICAAPLVLRSSFAFRRASPSAFLAVVDAPSLRFPSATHMA